MFSCLNQILITQYSLRLLKSKITKANQKRDGSSTTLKGHFQNKNMTKYQGQALQENHQNKKGNNIPPNGVYSEPQRIKYIANQSKLINKSHIRHMSYLQQQRQPALIISSETIRKLCPLNSGQTVKTNSSITIKQQEKFVQAYQNQYWKQSAHPLYICSYQYLATASKHYEDSLLLSTFRIVLRNNNEFLNFPQKYY